MPWPIKRLVPVVIAATVACLSARPAAAQTIRVDTGSVRGGRDPGFELQPGNSDSTVLIATVVPGTPAAKAGLKAGDELLMFNKERVTALVARHQLIATFDTAHVVKLTVLRSNKPLTVDLRLRPAR